MVSMPNWLPNLDLKKIEKLNGKVLCETSIMGPIFRLSGFAEDDPKIVEKYGLENIQTEHIPETLSLITKQIHPLLFTNRVCLFVAFFFNI